MRFTLKNRPPYVRYRDMEDWFEGFEAELREIREKYNEEPYEMYCKAGVSEVIKEILGE